MRRRLVLSQLAPLQAFLVLAPGASDWELALWVPGTRRSWIVGAS